MKQSFQNMKRKNKKLIKPSRRNKRRLLKKVVDYLKFDSYLFAPLVNSRSRSRQKIGTSSATGLEIKEPIKGKNETLLEKILDYMKSDSYLYASLFGPRPLAFPPKKGSIRLVKKVTKEISKRVVTMEGNKPMIQSENVVTQEKLFDGNLSGSQTLSHREMVKNMVYSNCRTSSIPGRDARVAEKQSPCEVIPWWIKDSYV